MRKQAKTGRSHPVASGRNEGAPGTTKAVGAVQAEDIEGLIYRRHFGPRQMEHTNEKGGGHKHGAAKKDWDCGATAQVPAKASNNRSCRHGKVVPAVKDTQAGATIFRTQGLGRQRD